LSVHRGIDEFFQVVTLYAADTIFYNVMKKTHSVLRLCYAVRLKTAGDGKRPQETAKNTEKF